MNEDEKGLMTFSQVVSNFLGNTIINKLSIQINSE